MAAVLLISAGPAGAHPHVWIDNITTFQFAEGRIVAIKLRWTFDELFGAGIIEQFDRDKNKRLDAQEQAVLKKGAFDNLHEYNYFTYVTVDGKFIPTRQVDGFSALIDHDKLVYEFSVKLDPPVDPVRQRLVLGVYDPSYFVDVDIGGREAVRYEGNGAVACHTDVAENRRKPIYFGQVFPLEMHLTCGAP